MTIQDWDGVFEAKPPAQLRHIAIQVAELVTDSVVLDQFRKMLHQWRADYDARASLQDDGRLPIELFPRLAMTPAEKYAALAAIHDCICESDTVINLWQRPSTLAEHKASQLFGLLMSQVEQLGEEDFSIVERLFSNVESELATMEYAEKVFIDEKNARSLHFQVTSATGKRSPIPAKARMSCPELAEHFDVDEELLRKRLETWRSKNDDGWKEVQDARAKEAQYVYEVSAIMRIIDSLQKSPANLRRKNKLGRKPA